MPLVQVTMIKGRSAEQKARIIDDITTAMERNADAPRETVRVIIQEVPAENWGVAGVPKSASP